VGGRVVSSGVVRGDRERRRYVTFENTKSAFLLFKAGLINSLNLGAGWCKI
jgi:hypothetical protein